MEGNPCRTGIPSKVAFILILAGYFSGTKGCDSGEWQCGSGECIGIKYLCNRLYECQDHTDEDLCVTTKPTVRGAPGCLDSQFQCRNKQCYYIDWQCDGTQDCADGTDEESCPELEGNGMMPKSSIIGMSVAVGGLFLILIAVIIMITCARRKNGPGFHLRRRRDINEVVYPGENIPHGPIACPTISGEIVLREPPPRYSSQPDLYNSRPLAVINLGFNPDETAVARPPPCYTSQPNLANDSSNLSLCSSVEAPPSYTSYQDANILDTNITEGTINLSFCPDEDDVFFSGHSTRRSSDGLSSMVSGRSWADNLDGEVFNLDTNTDEVCVSSMQCNDGQLYTESHGQYSSAVPSTSHLNQLNQTSSGNLQMPQNSAYRPQFLKNDQYSASKLASRVLRAKALGREYSSTPVLTYGNSRIEVDAAARRTKGDLKQNISRRKSNEFPDQKSTSTYDHLSQRKVKSVTALDDKVNSESKFKESKNPVRAESTSCCDSHSNLARMPLTGQGLKFWRNHKASLSKSCVHKDYSDPSIPEICEVNEGPSISQDHKQPVLDLPYSIIPTVPSKESSTSLSQLYTLRKNSLGSNNSINSWMC